MGSGRSSPARCSSRRPPRRRRSPCQGRRREGRCRQTRSAGRFAGALQDGSHYEARLWRAPGKSLGFPTAIDQDEDVLIGRKGERATLQALVDGAVRGHGRRAARHGRARDGQDDAPGRGRERVGSEPDRRYAPPVASPIPTFRSPCSPSFCGRPSRDRRASRRRRPGLSAVPSGSKRARASSTASPSA